MKTILTILWMMYALCAVGAVQTPPVKKTSLSESELRELAQSVPDTKIASVLNSVAMATTSSVDQQQEYFKAAAACLFACGKKDIYQKHIKGKLQNAGEFESRLKANCKQCSGSGKKENRCLTCSGNGKCVTCKGSGQLRSVGFNRPDGTKPCHQCGGSGRCRKCGGNGSTTGKCVACSGTGKLFDKSVAEHVFRDSCIAIADGFGRGTSQNVVVANQGVKVNSEAGKAKPPEDKCKSREISAGGRLAEVCEAEALFLKKCKVSGNCAQVEYNAVDYAIVKNTLGDYNFVVMSCSHNPNDSAYALAIFPAFEECGEWYAAVVKCTEKLKSWIRTAAENKVKRVSKEIPIYADGEVSEVYACAGSITKGQGQAALMRKTVSEPVDDESATQIVKFIGTVNAKDDTFEKYSVSIGMVCGDYFSRYIFSKTGTIEEIEKEIAKLLVFVNPEALEKARQTQSKKEDLFN